MAIQIFDENRKPSKGERLTGFLDRGMQQLAQEKDVRSENNAIKKNIGLDLSGIRDPSTRQTLIADQLKYGRQLKQSGQVSGAINSAQDLLGNTEKQPPKNNVVNQQPVSQPEMKTQEPTQSLPVETKKAESSSVPTKNRPFSVVDSAKQYVAEMRPDLLNPATQFGAISTFDASTKMALRPDEEAKIRGKLTADNVSPDVQDQVINNANQDIQTRYEEARQKYGYDLNKQNQINQKWKDFQANAYPLNGTTGNLDPILKPFEGMPQTQDFLKNRYFQYAGGLSTNATPEQMDLEAKAALNKDLNLINSAHAIPAMPPIRNSTEAKEYLNPVKNVYKDLVANGMMEVAKEDAFLNKDMGNEEFHSTVWGDQTSKDTLNKIHDLKAPEEYKALIDGVPAAYNKSYPKEREKYITDLSNNLKTISPSDDLILMRAMVLDQGGTIKDFTDALSKAESSGLKLSEFQKNQKGELEIPRKPPLWEIFNTPESLGSGFGGFVGSMLNWKPFINYLRGKR